MNHESHRILNRRYVTKRMNGKTVVNERADEVFRSCMTEFEKIVNNHQPGILYAFMEERSYLLKRSAGFVSATLSRIPASYTFHSLAHTRQVVRATSIIGHASNLDAEQLKAVLIAAWFHDVGYVGGAELHEERSASIALKMLTTWGADNKILDDVSRSILATRLPQNPEDILGMVLCDADLAHLGSPHYEMHVMLLRKEQEAVFGTKFENKRLWDQRNIEFLKAHRYFTEYGKEILDRRKNTNLNKMIQREATTAQSSVRI